MPVATKTTKRGNTKKRPTTKTRSKPPTPQPESLKVETWPLHEIKPYELNARKIPASAVEKIATSLKEFGWRQPMVVDSEGVLIVGHARRLAAVHLGWTHGPVHVARDLSPTQIRAYRLMDNRSHQETEWDIDILSSELSGLSVLDLDLSLTGFSEQELRLYLEGPGFGPVGEEEQGRLDQKKPCVCPACGHEFTPS